MSDGMKTVNLIEKVLDYECSVDDAITIETMMFKNMRTEIEQLTAELARYKQGVKVETIVHSNGSSWAGFDAYVHVQVPLAWSQQRVRVLVMKVEE